MHPMFKVYVQVVGVLMASTLVAQEQTYTAPQLFSGTLYLSTISELSKTQAGILNAELERTNNVGWLVGIGSSEHLDGSAIWRVLSARTWAAEPLRVDANAWSDEAITRLREMKRGSCVCIDDRALTAVKVPDRDQRAAILRSCLDRGVLMVVEATHTSAGSNIADQWNLTPDIDLVRIEKEPDTATKLVADRISLQVAQDSLLRIGRRDVANLSEKQSPASHYLLAATSHYQEPIREAIASLTVSDLTAARRALSERQQPMFPATAAYHPKLDSGSLVIVGGGGMSIEIWEKFVELAGGKESRIIVLPTAVPEPEYEDDDEVRTLKRFGASEVRVLPQTSREDVSKPEYLENFCWATGIWFGGGRQWRFVDAYWGTPAWQEIKQVLARGGVIGGSSAGATIQGDLLVRGHPLGNQIMIADGYRRGLGLLEGVAIDQHFKQRNRFDDLMGVVKRFPSIYAVGIDEGTALVVQSPDRCTVLGKGSVWSSFPNAGDRSFIEHKSGEAFKIGGTDEK